MGMFTFNFHSLYFNAHIRRLRNFSFTFDEIVLIKISQKVHQSKLKFNKKANVAKNRGQMIQNGGQRVFFCPV